LRPFFLVKTHHFQPFFAHKKYDCGELVQKGSIIPCFSRKCASVVDFMGCLGPKRELVYREISRKGGKKKSRGARNAMNYDILI
jgi:hypothetical protein